MNNTTNTSCAGSGIFLNFPIEWEISKWIRIFELFLTISLNLAVISLLLKMRKRSNLVFFVINLAISDLSVGIFHILPLTLNHFTTTWTLGEGLCKLKFYLSNISLYASTYLIVIIGIDRFHSVFKPLSTLRQLNKYRMLMVLSPWCFAAVISIPILYWTILYRKCGMVICTPDLRGIRKIVIVANALILLFIPALMIFTCYGLIVFLLCNRLKRENTMSLGEQKSSEAVLSLFRVDHKQYSFKSVKYRSIAVFNFSDLLRGTSSKTFTKANRRSTVITFVVGIAFILCWLPSLMATLLNLYGNIGYGGWFDILNALAPLNSVINPIIFLTFNHRMFKTSVKFKISRTLETRT